MEETLFYSGLLAKGAGQFLSLIRTYLLAQGWTSLGTIATNHEVFHSTGESGTENIIIAINNTTAYDARFRASTAYNNVTKVLSNPTTYRYITLRDTFSMPYFFFVKKDFFIAVIKNDFTYGPYNLTYCGLLNRYNPANPYCSVCSGTISGYAPAIGIAHNNWFTGGGFQLLKDHTGAYNTTQDGTALNANFNEGQLPNIVDGKLIISPVLIGVQGGGIQGMLYDAYSLMRAIIASEDIFFKNGDEYICFIVGEYKCAIKK
jgi:hypothetical protein